MRPEDVPADLVEKVAEAAHYAQGFDDWGVANETEREWSTYIARHVLAAVLPEVQAQAPNAAAVDLAAIANLAETEAGGDPLVMAAVESTRGDARLLRSIAARLTATTEGPTDG